MLKTLRGLPVRIPAEDAVRGVLSREGSYRVNAREHKAFEVHLDRVLFSRADGHAMERVPEEKVTELLTVLALAKEGEHYDLPGDEGAGTVGLHISMRAARVLVRVLSVRARMRTELGLA